MKRFSIAILFSALLLVAGHADDATTWTSKDGRAIKARFLKLDGESVVVEREGKEVMQGENILLARVNFLPK